MSLEVEVRLRGLRVPAADGDARRAAQCAMHNEIPRVGGCGVQGARAVRACDLAGARAAKRRVHA